MALQLANLFLGLFNCCFSPLRWRCHDGLPFVN
jgi:hypothetical protein